MTEQKLQELYEYSVQIRRLLHQFPEVGFDLPKTVKIVSDELRKMGIPCTEEYGTGSIVGEIGRGEKIVALRADMDALPVEEKTNLPYCSLHPGCMHACGHDSHMAVLLAVAKFLKEHENVLPHKVRFIFQPSEEGAISGAKMMVDQGVMENVEEVLCTHCDNSLESGVIGVCDGACMAACIPITISFHGKTSHATEPKSGVDAIAMAQEAYGKLKNMVVKEAGKADYIWSVGRFCGGHVHNVIADLCEMDISFRFFDMDFADRVMAQVRQICDDIANAYGGSVEIDWRMSTGPVNNDSTIAEKFRKSTKDSRIPLVEIEQRMTSEDFGWYLTEVPGLLFRFGTRNEATGCTAPLHRNDFCIDEAGMKSAIAAFIAYINQSEEMR